MQSDGSLTPSQSQTSFAQTYTDGVAQKSAANGLEVFAQRAITPEPQATTLTAPSSRSRHPRGDLLAAIETTGLRYAGHPGLRRARLSITDWLMLYRANIEVESGYRQDAISSAGAIGLGQLMPDTARDLGVDPTDLHQNLDGSARYLAMMLHAFGDARRALAAYNAGPDAVRRYSGIPPYRETQNHVARVEAAMARLKGTLP